MKAPRTRWLRWAGALACLVAISSCAPAFLPMDHDARLSRYLGHEPFEPYSAHAGMDVYTRGQPRFVLNLRDNRAIFKGESFRFEQEGAAARLERALLRYLEERGVEGRLSDGSSAVAVLLNFHHAAPWRAAVQAWRVPLEAQTAFPHVGIAYSSFEDWNRALRMDAVANTAGEPDVVVSLTAPQAGAVALRVTRLGNTRAIRFPNVPRYDAENWTAHEAVWRQVAQALDGVSEGSTARLVADADVPFDAVAGVVDHLHTAGVRRIHVPDVGASFQLQPHELPDHPASWTPDTGLSLGAILSILAGCMLVGWLTILRRPPTGLRR